MNRKLLTVSLCLGALGLASSYACAQQKKEEPKAAAPQGGHEMKLPAGWTEADMQACAMAATPGKMHEQLAKGVGTWQGKCTMWMGPGAEPVKSETTMNLTSMMDGRYTKCEVAGEMPGMGPFNGFGIYGYDNVSQKFVATWIDNCGTGIANGTGELSADGKVMTWKYTYNCPVNKKPTTMREVHTSTGPDSKKLEMYGIDPKSGQEFKMMEIEATRKSTGQAMKAEPQKKQP